MLNLFKSKKDPGKSPTKSPKKSQTPPNRTGVRSLNSESKLWFSKSVKHRKSSIGENQIKTISASSPALHNNDENKKANKRPLTLVVDSDVDLRRGPQTSKLEAQTPEDLSRSSSITNLNADQKVKGAKPKKAESKDKLDKVVEKKHEKNRTLNKNNNKESGDNAPDSLVDVEALQKQLAQMTSDKTNLALKLGEQTGQLNKLQNEIIHLRMLQEESTQKLEQLLNENTMLRNRLRDVAHSPLSDNEKQQLLYESHRHHNSAPASIATNLLEESGDVTACTTPEWDKQSSGNVSEVSVACLQDKINQMQETHYSTNEELQATLQELTDLQKQLTELQQENARVNDEKNLMFESLCRQTERLNDSRNEVESLKQLLYKDENGEFETAVEREQKLVELLKSAQEEREALFKKQEQLGNELEDSRTTNSIHVEKIAQVTERVQTLESTLDAKNAEHKLLDQELAQARDQSSNKQIEINRLKDLLENARTKINELEQDRTLSDKSELDELLDNARKEKDALESEVAHLKEKLALSKNENEKLREQLSILQEECKVTRNNAKTTQSDLEYKLEKVLAENGALAEQLQQFQEAVNELQVQTQCQLDDKRQLSAVLSETQRNLNESERRIVSLENELSELKKVKQEQEEEWEKFQNDLLTSVRVANDFKTEAQQDLQKLIMENKAGRERIKLLESQIEKLKGGNRRKTPPSRLSNEETLIASLNRRYNEIDSLPDSQLTEEQKAIKSLKVHYDRNFPRQKPVAPKPKDKLAISKPSLESVISNPKLEKIVKDSRLQNVESVTYFSDEEQKHNRQSLSPTRLTLIDSVDASVDEIAINRTDSFPKVQSDSGLQLVERFSKDDRRSKSLTDLPTIFPENEPGLRRYESTENLLVLTKEKKARKKSTVNLNTLEKICSQIDPNTPESELTKEQRLALRLREVLSKEGKKATLKKNPKLFRKKVVISRPTKESVEQNSNLYQIMNNPFYKSVDTDHGKITKRNKPNLLKKSRERYSMPVSHHSFDTPLKSSKKSKSYNDITFKFQVPNMYSEQEVNTFDVAPVLPPEKFRDTHSTIVEDNSAFSTFQSDNNTFKKEHSYLDNEIDDDGDLLAEDKQEKNMKEENVQVVHGDSREEEVLVLDDSSVDNDDDNISPHFEEVGFSERYMDGKLKEKEIDHQDEDHFIRAKYFYDNEIELSENISKEEDISESIDRRSEQSDFSDVKSTEEHTVDANDVITRRLEYEDDLLDEELDEEQRVERRYVRQRYSHVIEEMKEKFEKSSDEEEENENKKAKETSEDRQSTDENVVSPETELLSEKLPDLEFNNSSVPQIKILITEDKEEGKVESSEDDFDSEIEQEKFVKNITGIDDTEANILSSITQINVKLSQNEVFELEEFSSHVVNSAFGEDLTKKPTITIVTTDYSFPDLVPFSVDNYPMIGKDGEDIEGSSLEPIGGDNIDNFQRRITIFETKPNDQTSQLVISEDLNATEEERFVLNKENVAVQILKDDIKDTSQSIEEQASGGVKDINLTQEEINLIDSLKCEIDPRKVSDIKPEDVELISAMTLKYLSEKNVDEADGESMKENENPIKPTENLVKNEDQISLEPSHDIQVQSSTESNEQGDDQNLPKENSTLESHMFPGILTPVHKNEDRDSLKPSYDTHVQSSIEINEHSDDQNKLKENSALESHIFPGIFTPVHKSKDQDSLKPSYDAHVQNATGNNEQSEDQNKPKENSGIDLHVFPRILAPVQLNKPPSYEPVYENFYIASNKSASSLPPTVSGKKPVALPRISSVDTNSPIYEDYRGQVRKTRFSITYQQRKRDSFKEYKQEKTTSVKDLRNMFENKSHGDFSRLVSRALEDSEN